MMQLSSLTLGVTGLFWFGKKRTNYLKKSEAFMILSSFLLVLLGIPDFELSVAMLLKVVFLVSLGLVVLSLSICLLYDEKQKTISTFHDEVGSLVTNFINKNKKIFPIHQPYILVLIPAYNEGANLKELLKFAPTNIGHLPVVLLVIDDGSSDDTSKISGERASVLSLPQNRGGGYALFTGFFVAKKLNVPYVVTMDADGQHKFSDLKNLMTPILKGRAEIVLGSRFKTNSMYSNCFRSIGILLFNFILRIILGHRVSDCSNSYRAFTINALKKLDLKEEKHHTAEFVIRATKKKITMLEAPVDVQNRLFGKSKKGNSILYALRFTRTILTSWWRS